MPDIWKIARRRIRKQGFVTTAEIVERTGLTRQAVHDHLKRLRREGRLRKVGKTRGVKYVLPGDEPPPGISVDRTLRNEGLEEDRTFDEIAVESNLDTATQPAAFEILRYAFTEMLNNAIEHSESERIRLEWEIGDFDVTFRVKDYGIGVFENIRRQRGLDSELAALTDLLKGKTTTAPEGHSGEGIFFTSKCGDRMELASHRMKVTFDNRTGDVRTSRIHRAKGTDVRFVLSRRTRRRLKAVFDAHGGEEFDFAFSKTKVRVGLTGSEPVSRSQARRLLAGLDRFESIVLDFSGVRSLGQGFADEIFRVFRRRHPGIEIEVEGAEAAIRAMIDHVRGA